jgi:hypothetical protein
MEIAFGLGKFKESRLIPITFLDTRQTHFFLRHLQLTHIYGMQTFAARKAINLVQRLLRAYLLCLDLF